MNIDHLNRVVSSLMAQEEKLRSKQNAFAQAVNDSLMVLIHEIRSIKSHLNSKRS